MLGTINKYNKLDGVLRRYQHMGIDVVMTDEGIGNIEGVVGDD